MFFFSIIFFFDTFLLYKLSVLVNHSPQGSCKLLLKLCTFSVKLTSVNLVPVSTPSATNPPWGQTTVSGQLVSKISETISDLLTPKRQKMRNSEPRAGKSSERWVTHGKSVVNLWECEIGHEIERLTTKSWDLPSLCLLTNAVDKWLTRGEKSTGSTPLQSNATIVLNLLLSSACNEHAMMLKQIESVYKTVRF